jgi:hypothetical protein
VLKAAESALPSGFLLRRLNKMDFSGLRMQLPVCQEMRFQNTARGFTNSRIILGLSEEILVTLQIESVSAISAKMFLSI